MFHLLNADTFGTIKTQKCDDLNCQIASLFSNQIRAKHNKLVFLSDKLSLNCFGYHTEGDKRRPVFKNENENQLAYSQSYLVDILAVNKVNVLKNKEANKGIKTGSLKCLEESCQNLVEYLYHPFVYKTLKCPFNTLNQEGSQNICNYTFCPYLHQNEKIGKQLSKKLQKCKTHQIEKSKQQKLKTISEKQLFHQKILNIMILRSSNSSQDLFNKEKRIFNNSQNIQSQRTQNVQKDQNSIPIIDRTQIQKTKLRLKTLAMNCFNIDRQKDKQQQSRRIVSRVSISGKQMIDATFDKNQIQKIVNDSQSVSYNYFQYGQRLLLIEGRTIEFKHFKDISDPLHVPVIMKYICAFLNTEGGKLYIGVDDNSYVYGAKFKQTQYDKLLLNIDKQGKFNMTPPLMPQKYQIKLVPVYHDKKGQQRWVIQITVFPPPLQNKKLCLFNRQCYMRMNASTHKLNASDLIQFFSLNPASAQFQNKVNETIYQNQQQILNVTFSQEQKNQSRQNPRRQNQLMKQKTQKVKQQSNSRSKFKTQEQKNKQFEENLNKKSVQELYKLRKDYENKLTTIMQVYKKKQRQTR